jgi:hypothetical protein
MNNFIYKLTDYIKELKTGYPVQIGTFTCEDSLVVIPAEGSSIIGEYMDGTKEIRMSFEINIKSKSQEEAFNVLNDVINNIRNIGNFLDKEKRPYALLNIAVEQLPYFAEKQEIGYFIYNSKIVVDVTEIKI